MGCSRECRQRHKVSIHKFRSKGSKAWFLGRKHSAFLDRNRGHDRHSANGLYVSTIIDSKELSFDTMGTLVLTNAQLLAMMFEKIVLNKRETNEIIDAYFKMMFNEFD